MLLSAYKHNIGGKKEKKVKKRGIKNIDTEGKKKVNRKKDKKR